MRRVIEILLVLGILAVSGFIAARLAGWGSVELEDGEFFAPNIRNAKVTIPGRPHFIPDYLAAPRSVKRTVSFHFSTNSLGLRGPEVAAVKAPGTTRIAVVGECVAFGAGVDDDETWAHVLGELLEDTHPDRRFEVINAGISNDSRQVLRVLRDPVLGLRPDVVLFAPGADTAFASAHTGEAPFRLWLGDAEYQRALRQYTGVLRQALDLSRQHHFKLVFVTPTMNSFFMPDGVRWLDTMEDFARTQGVPVVDTTALVRAAEERDGMVFIAQDGHQRIEARHDGAATVLIDVPFEGTSRWIAPAIYEWLDDHPRQGPLLGIDENHPNAEGHRRIAAEALRVLEEAGAI